MCIFTYLLCAYHSKRGYRMHVSIRLCIEQSGRTQETAGRRMAQGEDLGGWGESRRETCLTLFYTVELLIHTHVFLGRIINIFNTKYIIPLGRMWVGSMTRSRIFA